MATPLRVLILEDRATDADLTIHELHRAGFAPVWQRVETEADYLAALDPGLDLILADYALPQFDAGRALELLKARGLAIPFIIVSGTIGEDVAVAAMRQGASDYLLKDRLARLGTAVEHALQQHRLRAEHQHSTVQLRESEHRYRSLIEALPVAVYITDAEGYVTLCNAAAIALWGREIRLGHDRWGGSAQLYTAEGIPLPHDRCPMAQALRDDRAIRGAEIVVERPDGVRVDCLAYPTPIHNAEGALIGAMNVLVDITERKRAEKALEAERAQLAERVEGSTADLRIANAQLARAARLKDEFLANMSHELRTPLSAILGRAELLEEGIYGPVTPRQIEALRSIDSSSRHLLALINDILDLSKIEANKLALQLAPVEVNPICQRALLMVAHTAITKQITLSSLHDPQAEQIIADERRLIQILVNLLTNAVKFTPNGGKVGLEVYGDRANQQVRFTVWDTGIGIAEEHRSKLFQPFTQIDSGLNREYSGTGLGLSLVLRLAQAHDGSVTVESTPGQGSRFSVMLPWHVAPTGSGHAEAPPAEGASTTLQRQLPAVESKASAPPVILLVDDNESGSQMLVDYLVAQGYTVNVARNGAEAITRARIDRPTAVLMDIEMPGTDGLEATRQLRADDRLRGVPIIALTALAMPGDRERCLAAGANDYLTKPVSMRTILTAITAQLGRQEAAPPPIPAAHHETDDA